MRILIIEKALNYRITGGQLYNSLMYEELQKSKNVDVLTDDIVGDFKIPLFYNFIYLFNYKKVKEFDYVLTGSSIYSRIVFFLLINRLINKKTKFVTIHHHFTYFTKKNKLLRFISKLLEILFLKLNHEVILPSEYTLDVSKQYLQENKLTYIPLGFNNTSKVRSKPKQKPEILKLLFVGKVSHRKGLIYLIDAIKDIKEEYILNIVGSYNEDDLYYKDIVEKIEKYGLAQKVKLKGRLNDDDLKSIYFDSDVFVFPSLYEGFGMVIAEAFTNGLPVIAFNNSAIPYNVIDDFNGILVKDKNVEELKVAILKLIQSRKLVEKLSENAIISAQNLNTYDTMLGDMNKWVSKKLN